MDERQIRALIVGRQFLDRAELLGTDGTEPDRMGAVVLADLAVEMAAKAAIVNEPLPKKSSLEKDAQSWFGVQLETISRARLIEVPRFANSSKTPSDWRRTRNTESRLSGLQLPSRWPAASFVQRRGSAGSTD